MIYPDIPGRYVNLSRVCLFLAALSIALWSQGVSAQQVTPEDLEALQQLKGEQDGRPTIELSPVDKARQDKARRDRARRDRARRGQGAAVDELIADTVILEDGEEVEDEEDKEPASRLEEDYSERVGGDLSLFGYDIFENVLPPEDIGTGRIPDDYVLGIGDELVFTFHGSTKRTVITRVDSEGRVILPDLRPIQAAGRVYSEFRRDVEERTATALLGTEVYVSVGSVRMMSILVMGEVYQPGLHRMTSLATVIEALALAGGVERTGSLRNIRISRDGGTVGFDLYDILRGDDGGSGSIKLRDGDRIIVPVIGATVAVDGEVKRPAIYELDGGSSETGIAEIIALAGGTLRPRGYAFTRTTFDDTGRQSILDVPDGTGTATDGDIITVSRRENVQIGSVSLVGHVRVPGQRSLAAAPSVADLIRDVHSLEVNPYLPFATIETTDPLTQARVFQPINLEHILAGKQNVALRDFDRVIVLSAEDVEFLSSRAVRTVILSGRASSDMCSSLQRLGRFVSDANLDRYATAVRSFVVVAEEQFEEAQPCPEIFEEYIDLLPFVLEYVIGVNGAVRRPGVFPVTGDTSLASLIAVTGGLSNNVDRTFAEILEYKQIPERGESSIERKILDLTVLRAEDVIVNPGSGVRFNALINDQERSPVLLVGEFVRPGAYTIRRGETLLDLVDRAGGLTDQAYPYGAVFTRESVRTAQQAGFRRTAREINSGLATAALKPNADGAALQVAQDIAQQLTQIEALGRIVIEADPTVLMARPGLNIVLAPGDRLFMPKRPNFVSVVGDVLNPAALQFFPGKKAKQYIAEAGGPLQSAEDKRSFVVFPNGEARPIKSGIWRTASVSIPPGSTIVVPKDVTPIDALLLTRELTTIVSQLAISAASIAVIGSR